MQPNSTTPAVEVDAVIVGAGPAGCMTAKRLGRAMRVMLVDSSALPRSKPCGGALNPYSWRFLQPFRPPRSLFLDPEDVRFRWVDFGTDLNRVTELEFKNVNREALDEWLLSLVPASVEIRDKTRFLSFESNCRLTKVRLETPTGGLTVRARYVIGADGALSQVRRQVLGADFATYSCIQDWVDRPASMPPYFDCIRIKGAGEGHAYTYAVPKGESALVGSVFYPGATSQKAKHGQVMAMLRDRFGIGSTRRRESAAALQVRSGRDIILGDGNVLLAGEAAGFISPTSGEGISYALVTGDMCAQAILAAPDNALARYRSVAAGPARSIARKARKLALLEYRAGHAMLAAMPLGVLSWMTKRL